MRDEYTGILYLQSNTMYGMTKNGSTIFKFKSFDGKEGLVSTTIHKKTRRNQFITVKRKSVGNCLKDGDMRVSMNLSIHHGSVDDHNAYLNALLRHYNLSVKIPNYRKMLFTPIEFANSQYINHRYVYTIDPESSEDYDDAISFYPKENKLGIHITYIGHQLSKYLSRLDNYCTIYSSLRTIHMLPVKYSTETFSLIKNRPRNVISLYLWKHQNKILHEWKLERIIVKENLSYENASEFVTPMLIKNAFNILSLKENNNEMEYYDIYGNSTMKLISISALLYNKMSAELMYEDYKENKAVPSYPFMIRKQVNTFAEYDYINEGRIQNHKDLNMKLYCHITSPIRRYSDIYNQIILFNILRKRIGLSIDQDQNNVSIIPIDRINEKIINSKKVMTLDWFYSLYNRNDIPSILKGTVKSVYKNTICIDLELLDVNKYIYVSLLPHYLEVLWNVELTDKNELRYKHNDGLEIVIKEGSVILVRVLRTMNPFPRLLMLPTFLWESDLGMALESVKKDDYTIFDDTVWFENYY
jgi:exoribonuclease R